jgi:hypothetical protein
MLLYESNRGLKRILAMLKLSGLILQLSAGIGLCVLEGIFICVTNVIVSTEVWVDADFEMIAIDVQGMDAKYTWEIISIYKDPNDDMMGIERSADRTLLTGNLKKRYFIGCDLN